MNHNRAGTYVGAGVAKNIELGFVPDFLMVMNVTDGTVVAFWHKSMAAGTAVDIVLAAAPNPDNGISAYNGDASHAQGFTVGTDYAVNGKTYAYIAFRAATPKTQPAGIASGASS